MSPGERIAPGTFPARPDQTKALATRWFVALSEEFAVKMQTRGEQMLALRRARLAASHPFLRGGFRPFFFGGAAWAVLALLLWLPALWGAGSPPTAPGFPGRAPAATPC